MWSVLEGGEWWNEVVVKEGEGCGKGCGGEWGLGMRIDEGTSDGGRRLIVRD